MTYHELEKHFGSCAAAGKALKLNRQTVHRWKVRGVIPFEAQYRIELATNGKLKAKLPK